MICSKHFVPMKRYFDYFKIIFIFLQKKGKSLDLILSGGWGGGGWLIEDLQWVRILHLIQSNGFDSGKGRQEYFAERQMATVRLWSLLIRVRKMSEFGSIRVIILVYTGRTDLKQIVSSQNNKMILFYFHGSVKHFNIVNAYSLYSLYLIYHKI